MTSQSLAAKLQRNLHLKSYLAELSALTSRPVEAHELGSPDDAVKYRAEASRSTLLEGARVEMPIAALGDERFTNFIGRLQEANRSSVYIWSEHSIYCGLLLVSSISSIKFDCGVGTNTGELIAFRTKDLMNRLLLDVSESQVGDKYVQIEADGVHWGRVLY
ncbi:MAG TPA: hypothetical protein VLF18_21555 [Tahibacter sp.]|uniref:hypothetical protein n=1 Tax=Tahibacter sp. TaxID=2056211 RepID=UPI002C8EEF8D|nr:hypothetical protein [Tahibacter sp.]HSX62778.1 hypothetical protein [Tahibacter sp.]